MLGINVKIRCAAAEPEALLTTHYATMRSSVEAAADLEYTVTQAEGSFVLARSGLDPVAASDLGELILILDQDLIIRLQELRSDLYFVHAGVLESAGRAFMLVAQSGGGKSTTTWALLQYGFRYLSDELAPVDVATLAIYPYPRALSLKSRAATPCPLPPKTILTTRSIHIQPEAIPAGVCRTPAPLAAIFFLRNAPDAVPPIGRQLSSAEASARLYPNVLNALAHPGDGLDGAVRIASNTVCFQLSTADLMAACAFVRATAATLR
jgi:hypothetical protein